jgi:hypothetical protein
MKNVNLKMQNDNVKLKIVPPQAELNNFDF